MSEKISLDSSEEKYNRQHGMARRFQAHKNDGSYMPVIVSANLFF